MRNWNSQIGTWVNGLLSQQAPMAIGTFPRNRAATSAAGTIWKGIGIIEKNRPAEMPVATELRHGTQKLRCNKGADKHFHQPR